MHILVLLLCPFPFLCSLLYMSVLEWQPWNWEFGSPPSTLSCHLSLKNDMKKTTQPPPSRAVRRSTRKKRLGTWEGTDTRRVQRPPGPEGPRGEQKAHPESWASAAGAGRVHGTRGVSGGRSHLHSPILSFAGGKGLGHQGTAGGPTETPHPSRAAWSP